MGLLKTKMDIEFVFPNYMLFLYVKKNNPQYTPKNITDSTGITSSYTYFLKKRCIGLGFLDKNYNLTKLGYQMAEEVEKIFILLDLKIDDIRQMKVMSYSYRKDI